MPTATRPRILQEPPLALRVRAAMRRTWPVRMVYRRKWARRADVLVISFPKAGRTWMRLLLAKAIQVHCGREPEAVYKRLAEIAPDEIDVPKIALTHDDNPHLKTPAELVRNKTEYSGTRIILLARDPRDIVVSLYFQMTRRDGLYEGDMGSFIRCDRGGLDSVIAFYNIWARQMDAPAGFLLVRYEDMKRDANGELERMLHFAGIEGVQQATIEEAVAFGSFDNMRKLELEAAKPTAEGPTFGARLQPRSVDDPESFKTRRGKVGGFLDYLNADEIAWMNERIRSHLSPLYGYGELPAERRSV